jgi:trans-aconitate methyltransferase
MRTYAPSMRSPDLRRFSDASVRNRGPIGDILARLLPPPNHRLVFEIGAGTGQHAVDFATRFPHLTWQPADRPDNHPSIEAWRESAALPNLRPVIPFDLFDPHPPLPRADVLLAINVLHIAPASAISRLFFHAAALLPPGGLVIVYGPFRYPDRPLEPSNLAFEQALQLGDAERGIREVVTLDAEAHVHGFTLGGDEALPANNHLRGWSRA